MLQRFFGHIGASSVNAVEAKKCVCARKSRPSGCKIRVKLHRSLEITDRFQQERACVVDASLERHATQIRFISLRVVCWSSCQSLLLATGKLRLQRLRDSFGDLALDVKDVTQLPIIRFRSHMGIGLRIKQPNADSHLVARFLDAALKNVGYAKLTGDLGEIGRLALISLRGRARNDF
jgi:hypothetical protein